MQPDELADVLATVRHFVRSQVVPLEEQIDTHDEIPSRIIETCKTIGLYGFAIPEDYGGLGLSVTEEAQLVFELGWTTPALRSLLGLSGERCK